MTSVTPKNVAAQEATLDERTGSGPLISFVVETCNIAPGQSFDAIDCALAGIARQTLPPDSVEVLVMSDPQRTPGLRAHLERSAPQVRVVDCPGLHYYAQKNLGARLARADVVGFVDADCDPVPEWAEAVLDTFARGGERVAVVQGRYRTHSLARSSTARAFLVTTFGHQAAATERALSSLAASNCAVRRNELLERPFREDPFFHGPDVAKAAELQSRGAAILLASRAINSHDHEPGLRAQHVRGMYWGYCFLKLRHSGGREARYGRLFRALGPIAPFVLAPAKAIIDLRRLVQRRSDLELGVADCLGCAAMLLLNSLSVGAGAARFAFGLSPPRSPQETGAAHA
jgi:hypothetical protein